MSDQDFEKRIRHLAQQRAARTVARRLYARQAKRKALRKARPWIRALFWTALVWGTIIVIHSIPGLILK